uniref:Uncharacterized protein n=1 Tax=Picea glauca TaxID=3330 RepID=A0A101LXX6_PICGL|nr:hypothetical protein ABT39_MTgene5586 [Picea glauca]QHR89586.1 hypothetical protein Q903MT_gene3608 [Picea sitchensis]
MMGHDARRFSCLALSTMLPKVRQQQPTGPLPSFTVPITSLVGWHEHSPYPMSYLPRP